MITAALTGNIGMGKSNALRAFAELGVFTLSADAIVSELLEDASVVDSIRFILGDDIIDPATGKLIKAKVADKIFSDDAMREAVEAILHPMVFTSIMTSLNASGADIAVIEIPMLFETNSEAQFNRSITVYTDEGLAIDRLQDSGASRDDIVRRLMCQMSITDKISKSDFTIDNSGKPEDILPRIKQILRALKAEL